MATTIATNVGASMSAATGRPSQGHLVYGPSTARWYLFYLTGTQNLSLKYSSDFSTWTDASPASFALTTVHNSEGRNFGFDLVTIGGIDHVHMVASYSGSPLTSRHARFALSGGSTTWTTDNGDIAYTSVNTSTSNPSGATCLVSSTGVVCDSSGYISVGSAFGDQRFLRFPNADTASTWTVGTPTPTLAFNPSTVVTSNAFADLGSGNILNVCDNAGATGFYSEFEWTKWTTSWSTAATAYGGLVTNTNSNQWGLVARTTTEVHLVGLVTSTTFRHRIFNGTSWSAGASIPAVASLVATSGIFLATDGTKVWAFVIDGSNNIQYVTYSGGAWSGSWTTLDAGGANGRSSLSGCQTVSNNAIGLIWTEANGANFNIAGTTLSLSITSSLQVANCAVAGQTLSVAPSGGVSNNLDVANVVSSAPTLTTAPSGSASLDPGISNVSVAGQTLTTAPSGGVSIGLLVRDVSAQAADLVVSIGTSAIALDVANAAVDAPTLSLAGSGTATVSLLVADVASGAPTLSTAASGSAPLGLQIANVGVSGPTITLAGSGSISTSLQITNAAVAAPTLTVTAGGLQVGLDVANVGVAAPTLSMAPSSGVSIALQVADVTAGAATLTIAPGPLAYVLATSDVSVGAPSLTYTLSEVTRVLDVADVVVAAPTLTTVPSGSPSVLPGVADVSVAAPTMTVLASGSASLDPSVANVQVGAPDIVVLLAGHAPLDVADVAVIAPALGVSGTGSATFALDVAGVAVSAATLATAVSGTTTVSLDVAGIATSAPSLGVSGTGGVTISFGLAPVAAQAPTLSASAGLSGNQAIPLAVANVATSGVSLGIVASGVATLSLGVANAEVEGFLAAFSPQSLFAVDSSFTVLLN